MTKLLSDPITFPRGPAMKNRFMLAPLTNLQNNPDGTLSEDEYRCLTMRADGGFGLIMTCAAHVQKSGQGFPGQLGVWSDNHLPGLERLARGIKAKNSISSVQLVHGGERAAPDLTRENVVAPWDGGEFDARALTTGEVEQLIEDFIAAAVRAEKAGFDGVELHGAHGYLLCQFLDAERNQRNDPFGGSYENRTRIFWRIIDGIRAATGESFQLGLRLSPERYGMDLVEIQRFAQEVMISGKLDYLDMSLWNCFKPSMNDKNGPPLIDYFTGLDRGNCPLGVAGKIVTVETVRRCIEHGADFVLIGRGAILHHDFANKAMADPDFISTPLPVTRSYLEGEGLGQPFIDYIANTWSDFVAA